MNKNYNFERKKMNLPEYGRNILKMVEFLMSIEDRELRNQQARVVIDVMGNINNHLRDTDDLKHKLWDHLFIISNFELDVDAPYPKPSPEKMRPSPDKIPYPKNHIRWKHYGRNIDSMVKNLKDAENIEDRDVIIGNIAKYMRNKSHEFNLEHPNNETIINDIREMSGNTMAVESTILDGSKSEYRPISAPARINKGKGPHKKQVGKVHVKNNNQRKANYKKHQ